MPAHRWRVALTVVAWLLILQSGSGALSAGLGLALQPLRAVGTTAEVPGAGEIFPGRDALLPTLRLLETVVRVGFFFHLALLAGAVGLLRRRRWGWYAVVLLHIAGAGGLFAVLPTVFGEVLALAAPGAPPLLTWALAVLAVLPALALIGFLLLDPVLRQFAGAQATPFERA